MIIKTRGICLHTTKYSETSVIAQVYTEAVGLQSYIISGVRQRRPRVHASLLQPMSVLDLVAYYHPQRTLFRTREIRSAYNFTRIPFELGRSSVCLFAAEVLLKALRESEAQGELFGFVTDFLLFVDATDEPLGNLPAFFLTRLTEYLGFRPEAPTFGGPYYFDELQGYFLPEVPEHEHYADAEASAFMVALMASDVRAVAAIPTTRYVRNAAVTALLAYLRTQMDRFQGVTSHRVLAEVLRA